MTEDIYTNIALFDGLNSSDKELLKSYFIYCDFPSETLLFEQGDTAEYLYWLLSGEVTIRYKPEDGPEIIVTRVKPGGIVGWSAAVGNRYYTSGAICSSDSQFLRVHGEGLRELCSKYPHIGMIVLDHLALAIAERLSNSREMIMTLLRQRLCDHEIKSRRKRARE